MSTPIARAIASHDLDRCQQLMREGADLLAPGQVIQVEGRALDLLETAITQSWAPGVDWLLSRGLEPKPWHLEAAVAAVVDCPGKMADPNKEAIVERLLDAGAPVEARAIWCAVQPRSSLSISTFARLVKNCQNWPAPSVGHTIGTQLLETRQPYVAKRLELLALNGPVFTETAVNGNRVWLALLLRAQDAETPLLVDLALQHQGWRQNKNPSHTMDQDMAFMVQRFPGAALMYIRHPKFPWDELSSQDKELMLAAGIHNSNHVTEWVRRMLDAGASGDKPVEMDGAMMTAIHAAIRKTLRRADNDVMTMRMVLVLQALVDHGVDPNLQIKGQDSPMRVALAGDASRPVLEVLIQAGGQVEMGQCSPSMPDEKRQWLTTVAQQQSMETQTAAAKGPGRPPRL